jgi:hypothetical protein
MVILFENTYFGTDSPVPKINIIYLLLHAIYLDFQIFIHGQSAIIIEYLENKENVYYAQ